jgi:hypothetical protein
MNPRVLPWKPHKDVRIDRFMEESPMKNEYSLFSRPMLPSDVQRSIAAISLGNHVFDAPRSGRGGPTSGAFVFYLTTHSSRLTVNWRRKEDDHGNR